MKFSSISPDFYTNLGGIEDFLPDSAQICPLRPFQQRIVHIYRRAIASYSNNSSIVIWKAISAT